MIYVRTDVKNALNSGDRRWIIRVLETHFPEFGPLVRALYDGPNDLYFTDSQHSVHHIQATKGVTQGCPLASHLFNVALHAIDERVLLSFDKVLKMGYCDDSYFTSESIDQLKVCTDEIAERCKRYAGLTYCQHKYEALVPAELEGPMPEAFQNPEDGSCTLAEIHRTGMEFVGIPVALPTDEGGTWTSKACLKIVTEGHNSLKKAAAYIRKLPLYHEQAFLLRACLAPMITHLLRSCPPPATAAAAHAANEILKEAWSHTNGLDIGGKHFLSDDSLVPKQLALPISKGGDGITDPRAIANAAFLGSWALWFQPWKETMEEASEKEALIGDAKALSEHLYGLCRQIWEPISQSGAGPTTSGSDLETTSTAHNPRQMHRRESLDQSEGSGASGTTDSRVTL